MEEKFIPLRCIKNTIYELKYRDTQGLEAKFPELDILREMPSAGLTNYATGVPGFCFIVLFPRHASATPSSGGWGCLRV